MNLVAHGVPFLEALDFIRETLAQGGQNPESTEEKDFPHCVSLFGWQPVNGVASCVYVRIDGENVLVCDVANPAFESVLTDLPPQAQAELRGLIEKMKMA